MPDEFSVRLCQHVQQHPELYDCFNERFHDDKAKESAWIEVERCLRVPQSECKIKWKKIRHEFVKAKKEQNTRWDLWPYLQFLVEAEARSLPDKSPNKGKASKATANSPGTPRRNVRSRRVSEARTTTADSTGFSSLSADTFVILPKSALDKAIQDQQVPPGAVFLKEVVSGKHASSSEDAGPSPKRLRTEGSGAGAYSQGSQATVCGAVLDQRFLQKLEEKFARLRPDIRGTMKATILEMLDGAAK
uniref:Putative alcohol dehydrogenase transcription factor myb/sant-like protein n=1 Tax=Amblyomma cajennense TaxID=34607 RepID=A0A023FCJ5_AMBCJ